MDTCKQGKEYDVLKLELMNAWSGVKVEMSTLFKKLLVEGECQGQHASPPLCVSLAPLPPTLAQSTSMSLPFSLVQQHAFLPV
jgi:hypothetical protein